MKVKASNFMQKGGITTNLIPIDTVMTADRVSVGGSVKITRKTPNDAFVSIEASCNFSANAPRGKRESVAKDAAIFVRKEIKRQLEKEIAMVAAQMN